MCVPYEHAAGMVPASLRDPDLHAVPAQALASLGRDVRVGHDREAAPDEAHGMASRQPDLLDSVSTNCRRQTILKTDWRESYAAVNVAFCQFTAALFGFGEYPPW